MKQTGKCTSWQQTATGVTLILDRAHAEISFFDPDRVRVQLSFSNSLKHQSYVLQESDREGDSANPIKPTVLAPAKFSIQDTTKELTLETSKLIVTVKKDAWCITVATPSGQVLHQDLAGRSVFVDDNGRLNHYFRRSDGDQWYGLGEKTGPLEKSGRRYRMENTDAVGYDPQSGDPLYKHIPWLARKHPHGFWSGMFYHNANPAEFDLGATRSGYWGEFASARFDDGDLDLFVFSAENLPNLVRRYTQLTGLPPIMPRYSLGYMASTMFYTELPANSDDAIKNFMERCDEEGIPVSGFHLSSGYTVSGEQRWAFHWNPQRFPDPSAFNHWFSDRNQYLSPNIKPALLTSHPQFNDFAQAGAFVGDGHLERFWGGDGAFVDFTAPEGRRLWSEQLKSSLLTLGITSIWNDNNEFEFSLSGVLAHGDGNSQSVNGLRPIMSNLMAKVAFDAVREQHPNIRPFILSRAGFSGLQHWAQTWSGDNGSSWEYLRSNVTTMLGMSLSGVAFNGMDVGGFTGPAPEPELFLRWIQNAVFHPRFCIHSANDDNTVTEPWMYESVKPEVVAALQLRGRLMPCLYQLAWRAHTNGDPIVRPLIWDFPNDKKASGEQQDFMLGSAIFVPAVLSDQVRSKEQYFPGEGNWVHMETSARVPGGQRHTLETPLESTQWFLREGEWLVMSDDPFNAENLRFVTTLTPSQYRFYWDDGISYDCERGQFLDIQFEVQVAPSGIEIQWQSKGEYKLGVDFIHFQLFSELGAPKAVILNSDPMHHVFGEIGNGKGEGFHFKMDYRALELCINSRSLEKDGRIILDFGKTISVSI